MGQVFGLGCDEFPINTEGTHMHAFHRGELLIGGMALRHLHGELEREEPTTNSTNWLLSGKLHVPAREGTQLELERQYLLRIEDGREGLVELTSLAPANNDMEASFRPRARSPH
jgi:hypothetical protein